MYGCNNGMVLQYTRYRTAKRAHEEKKKGRLTSRQQGKAGGGELSRLRSPYAVGRHSARRVETNSGMLSGTLAPLTRTSLLSGYWRCKVDKAASTPSHPIHPSIQSNPILVESTRVVDPIKQWQASGINIIKTHHHHCRDLTHV
jgi:hypothetical protein